LHDQVFTTVFEDTIDDWTQNGQMRLCNADGGMSNWISAKVDDWWHVGSLEQFVYPPEILRPMVKADLKAQLRLWATHRRKIDLSSSSESGKCSIQ